MSLVGKFFKNRYKIIEKIGQGGMACVYKAEDELLNRFVAIKVLKPDLNNNEDFIEKFNKEAKAAAKLSHPNIVNVYDVGEEDGIKYIVMELIQGKNLKELIQSTEGFLDEKLVIKIAKQIASALAEAHSNNIIHRDIKPENIIIDKFNNIKVADFGIARAVTTSTLVNTKQMLGSVHYCSPEQSRGSLVDNRSDIYSLGILIYELATKKVPFDGDNEITIALKHLKEEFLQPSEINSELSNGLEKIIIKSTRKKAVDRYQDINDLIDDLNRLDNNQADDILFFETDEEVNETKILPTIGDVEHMSRKNNKYKNKKSNKPSFFMILMIILAALFISVGIFALTSLDEITSRFENQEVTVPDVVNLAEDRAVSELRAVGLEADTSRKSFSSEIATGHVITQSTSAGEKLKEGYTVELTISKGPRLVMVPNVIHKNLTEGKIQLENANLDTGRISYEFSDLPQGTIIDQDPLAGSEVNFASEINLTISQGQEDQEVLVPNLLGLSLQEAQERLSSINLAIGDISYEESTEYVQDTIMTQSISPSTEVAENSIINITISQGSSEPEEQPTDSEIQKTYIIPLSFEGETAVVKVEKIQDGATEVVYEKEHNKSEENVRVVVSGTGEATIKFYFDDNVINTRKVIFE
jgi:serine/threonine-protein kinase